MSAIKELKAVLLGAENEVAIAGSDEDRQIITRTLAEIEKQSELLVLELLKEKQLTKSFSIFVNCVKKDTHSMSYEKMHPTLKVLFNHLLTSLRFAEEALSI